MSKKTQPRLHLVRGGLDPDLYCSDLDWYFCSYDSECGLKSIAVQDILSFVLRKDKKKPRRKKLDGWDYDNLRFEDGSQLTVKCKSRTFLPNSDIYGSRQVDFDGSGSFTRGRRVWAKLQRLRWDDREALRRYYEPRQIWQSDEKTWEKDGGLKLRRVVWEKQPEETVIALHRAYYGVAA